ncbi:MAG TPA: tetraacyldisaccharide 4'-kinase [Terriglobia bacterium]|nr:tetraacyldisaccharide 4'-kinase [Terriglobia bacterium]
MTNATSRILWPLAACFGWGVALRAAAYRRGWLATRRLGRPVVSVGNLSVGGTGKTPLVEWLARTLAGRGLKPGILTRGYGRRRGDALIAIAPGAGRAPDPRAVGDEPAWLARTLADVPIVVGADRYRAGRMAEDRFHVGVHLLDDGFQHLGLERQADIVALDATQNLEDQALLPAGRLREPMSALARAHFIVLTRTELADPAPLEARVRQINPRAGIFRSRTKLCRLVDAQTGEAHAPGAWRGQPVHACCGIGNPQAFAGDLASWGLQVTGRSVFGDHHVYGAAEIEGLGARAREAGARALVVTEKDAINFPARWRSDVPVLACAVGIELDQGPALEQALVALIEPPATPGAQY